MAGLPNAKHRVWGPNLYTCDRTGHHLRRLTFDQVHDNYPTVLPDGRIV